MHYVKVVSGVMLGILVFLFLDYALPSKNTVRITNTYNRVTSVTTSNAIFYAGEDTGTVQNVSGQRDIRFIDTIRPNGNAFVYRNEDTGWIWPPYFKYDSSNLQARATDLRSTAGSPEWVSVTAYGWRIPWLTVYPNAVGVKPVAGPDVHPTNWPAIIILLVLGVLLFLLWRMWNQFHERTIEPVVQSIDDAVDRADARADEARGRFSRWLGSWKGRPRG